jgi:hypothetical protein
LRIGFGEASVEILPAIEN